MTIPPPCDTALPPPPAPEPTMPTPAPANAPEARRLFPRGLVQPSASFRFSTEALLLAAFLMPRAGSRILDLGTGCGVVALATLCRQPDCFATGVDIQSELVAAARANAVALGFANAFTALCADLADPALFEPAVREAPRSRPGGTAAALSSAQRVAAASFDLVLANPPYRQGSRGRLPHSVARRIALFEEPDTLEVFCRAAFQALVPGGRFGIVYPASRFTELVAVLEHSRLFPLRALPLAPRQDAPPALVLVEALHTAPKDRPVPREEPPLILHEGQGPATRFSEEAVRFCPFLACPD